MATRDEFNLSAEETPMTADEIFNIVNETYSTSEKVEPTYIEVTVDNATVYLEGSVSSQEEKEAAETLLDSVEGIAQVVNNLEVVEINYTGDEPWPGIAEPEIEEFGPVEVIAADEELATDDIQSAIEDGKSYVPPQNPDFSEERAHTAERMRERVAEEEATGEAPDKL
ncbi:MAG: BON domain-containing protein [Candidatus Aquicultor sp.]